MLYEVFTRTANLLRQKRHYDAPSAKTLYTFTPPPYRVRHFLSQRNALLTEFSCGKLALFFCKNHKNSRSFGKNHKNSRLFCAFSPFKRTFVTSSACFWDSGTLPKPHAARFWRKCERILLSWHVFGLLALAHCFPGAFSAFSRLRIASLARFRLSRACALLPRCFFGFFACAHGFPGSFSGFSRLCTAFSARFRAFIAARCVAYRVFLRKTRAVLAKNTKIRAYSVRFHPPKKTVHNRGALPCVQK